MLALLREYSKRRRWWGKTQYSRFLEVTLCLLEKKEKERKKVREDGGAYFGSFLVSVVVPSPPTGPKYCPRSSPPTGPKHCPQSPGHGTTLPTTTQPASPLDASLLRCSIGCNNYVHAEVLNAVLGTMHHTSHPHGTAHCACLASCVFAPDS